MILYNLGIHLYHGLAKTLGPFQPKAKLFTQGRKQLQFPDPKKSLGKKKIWIHVASLGEFEQARPFIELLRRDSRHYILLTFFSPSGYEIQKKYAGADWIAYLPADLPSQVKTFLHRLQPSIIFFVKYDFWLNYLHEIKAQNIPCFLIDGLFHEAQPFFKWYGNSFRKALSAFTHFYIQNHSSQQMLEQLGIKNSHVCGDTRYDRVSHIREKVKPIPGIADYVGSSPCILLGSSYAKEEQMMLNLRPLLVQHFPDIKIIIAPHHVDDSNIQRLCQLIEKSGLKPQLHQSAHIQDKGDIYILNTMGQLSSAYQYGHIALIGGGFISGIHNILEALIFGLPVLFGPNYKKYDEALAAIAEKVAFSFQDEAGLEAQLLPLLKERVSSDKSKSKASEFVTQRVGASTFIYEDLKKKNYVY